MLERSILLARVKRSLIEESAGGKFYDENLVSKLALPPFREDTDVLFGLVKSEQCWTLIARRKLIFKVEGSSISELAISEVKDSLITFYRRMGKAFRSEYIDHNDGRKIWVVNVRTAYALQNIFLLLEKEDVPTIPFPNPP